MKWYKYIEYSLFPKRCAYCNKVINYDLLRCDSCENELVFIDDEVCLFCGNSKKDCECRKHKSEYSAVIAPFYYNDLPASAVRIMKFQNKTAGIDEMAYQIFISVKKHYNGIDFDFVTDVPMSKKGLKKRGFNQSACISKAISNLMDKPYVPTLKKIYDNEQQHLLDMNKRKGNVIGVYDLIDNCDVTNKNILLIDDVKTSGATLNECAKILKIYGANKVYCACFAVTKKDKFLQ